MKLLITLFIFLFSSISISCNISDIQGLAYFPSLEFDSSELKQKGCSEKTLESLRNFLLKNNGHLPYHYLSEIGDFQTHPELKTLKVHIVTSLMQKKCNNEKIVFKEINYPASQNPITLKAGENLKISGLNCDGLGEKGFNLIKRKNHQVISSQPAFAQLHTKMKACYVKESPLNYSQSALNKIVIPKEITTRTPESYISFDDNLSLYQLRRRPPLHKLLRMRDIKPLPLTKAGREVTLIIRSEGLRISTRGKARKTATLGEMIEAVNLKSKKKVWGKVIGENEIEVKL